jgi:predicted amidophosphoribosyltransferase
LIELQSEVCEGCGRPKVFPCSKCGKPTKKLSRTCKDCHTAYTRDRRRIEKQRITAMERELADLRARVGAPSA